MRSIKVEHYEAFSTVPSKGNPAGIVLDGEGLTDSDRQKIAKEVGFNETAFPLPSERADVNIRFFTPGHEINLCGHATMATIYALKTKGLLPDRDEITIETKAGILPIRLSMDVDRSMMITMKQAAPQLRAFSGSRSELAASLALEEKDLHEELPVVYGSTGTWTLLIPIKKLDAFKRMQPNNQHFPDILQEMPRASVHPFCLETYDQEADMHARHFSSPYSGTVEDPVTGTASGVMGAYYHKYIESSPSLQLIVEQGHEIGKDGRIAVTVTEQTDDVMIEISGNAVLIREFEVRI
jgi:PhzF family phenazine biosynthesis protein